MDRRVAFSASILSLVATLLVASCSKDEAVQPPSPAAKPINPSASAQQLWEVDCAECHGKAGRGDTERGVSMKMPDMSRPVWQAGRTKAKLAKVIRDGYSGITVGVHQHMNAFRAELTDEQVEALVELVRSFEVR